MTKLTIARYVSLLVTGVGAGVSLSHALQWSQKAKLSSDEFFRVQSTLYNNYGVAGAILENTDVLSTAATAYFVGRRSRARTLTLLALGCQLASIAVWALLINPINQRGRTWTAGNLPPDWAKERDRWHRLHAVRLGLSLTGFSALLLSVLGREQPARQEAATLAAQETGAVDQHHAAPAIPSGGADR